MNKKYKIQNTKYKIKNTKIILGQKCILNIRTACFSKQKRYSDAFVCKCGGVSAPGTLWETDVGAFSKFCHDAPVDGARVKREAQRLVTTFDHASDCRASNLHRWHREKFIRDYSFFFLSPNDNDALLCASLSIRLPAWFYRRLRNPRACPPRTLNSKTIAEELPYVIEKIVSSRDADRWTKIDE